MEEDIKQLNQTQLEISQEILRVKLAASKVEAYLLNQKDVPSLNTSLEDVLNANNRFFGIYQEERLAALVEVEDSLDDEAVLVSLVVDPQDFRKGYGSSLVRYVSTLYAERTVAINVIRENLPVIRLLQKLGFITKRAWITPDSGQMIRFERKPADKPRPQIQPEEIDKKKENNVERSGAISLLDRIPQMIKSQQWILLAAFGLGIVFDLLFFKRPFGLNFAIFCGLSLVVGVVVLSRYKIRPHNRQWWLLFPTGFFLFSTVFRAEPLTKGLSIVFALLGMGLFAIYYNNGCWVFQKFWGYLINLLKLVVNTIFFPIPFFASFVSEISSQSTRKIFKKLGSVLLGIIIALPLVLVLAGLLGSADYVFHERIQEFIRSLGDLNLMDSVFQMLLILFAAYLILGTFLSAASTVSDQENQFAKKSGFKKFIGFTETTIVMGSVLLLFILFVVVQFQYFFGGQVNIGIEYSYSSYARRGFDELISVAFISLVLIVGLGAISKRENKFQRWFFSFMSLAIVAFVEVILVSAFHRLTLAIDWHGYSRLRLYPRIFIVWLGIILLVVVLLEIFRKQQFIFHSFLAASIGFAVSLSMFNVDAAIVTTNVHRAVNGKHFNVPHLSGLSTDAVPVMVNYFQDEDLPLEIREGIGAALICFIYDDVYQEVETLDWRSYDYSQQQAYLAINQVQKTLESYHVNSGGCRVIVDTPSGEQVKCERGY